MQHMVPSLSKSGRGGLLVHRLSENPLSICVSIGFIAWLINTWRTFMVTYLVHAGTKVLFVCSYKTFHHVSLLQSKYETFSAAKSFSLVDMHRRSREPHCLNYYSSQLQWRERGSRIIWNVGKTQQHWWASSHITATFVNALTISDLNILLFC
jgi:hypothetical protein